MASNNEPRVFTDDEINLHEKVNKSTATPRVFTDNEISNSNFVHDAVQEDIKENLPETPEDAKAYGLPHYLSKGFVEGLANAADTLPNTVVGAVRGLVELPYMAFNGGKMTGVDWSRYMDGYSKAANMLYDYVPEPETMAERITQRAGEETSYGLVGMGVAGRVIGPALQAVKGTGVGSEVARMTGTALTASIRSAPKATSAYTVASSTTGAVGAEVGKEVAPPGKETDYELAGLIIGSFSPDAIAAVVKFTLLGRASSYMGEQLKNIPEYYRTKGASLETKLNQARAEFNQAKRDLEVGNISPAQYETKHRELNNYVERYKVTQEKLQKLNKHASDLLKRDLRVDSPEVQERLAEIHDLTKEIEGFSPTLGQSVGDLSPDIKATQKVIDELDSPKAMDLLENNKEVLKEYTKRAFTTPTQKMIRTVFGSVGYRWTALDRKLALLQQGYVDDAWRESAIFRDNPSMNELGSDIKDKLLESLSKSNARKNVLFNIDPQNKIQLPTKTVSSNIEKIVNKWKDDPLAYPDEIPDYWTKSVGGKPSLLDTLKENNKLTYNQLRSIEIRAGEEIRSLSAAVDKPASLKKKLNHLRELQRSVEFTLDKLSSGYGDVSKKYMVAKRWYRTQYAPAYLQGASKEILGVKLDSASRIEVERIPYKFFTPEKNRNVSAAKQFNHVFRGDPEAQLLVEKAAMKMVEDYAFNKNTLQFNESRYFDWLSKHSDVLNEFPNLKAKLMQSSDTLKTLAEHKSSVIARRDLIASSNARKYMNADPEAALTMALSSPSEARRLMRSVQLNAKNPEELSEFKQSISSLIWDRVYGKGRPDNFILESPELALNYLIKNKESIGILMTERDSKSLSNYLKALKHLKSMPTPTGRPLGQDVLKETLIKYGAPSPASVLSRAYAHAIGKVGKVYIVGDVATRALNSLTRAHYNKIFKEALYNPELRESLLHLSQVKKITPEFAKKFKYNLLNIGIVLDGEEDDNQ